jgi:ferredoxin
MPPEALYPRAALRWSKDEENELRRSLIMAKIPVVNQSECISCGVCTEICPGVFRLNDENISEVINPAGDSEEKIQEAIDNCPVQCIHWNE